MAVDTSVYARIQKLLAIQESRGATEAEAALAAEHIQKLLQDHNLSLSQIEADNKTQAIDRIKQNVERYAIRPWEIKLMETLARNNFCSRGASVPAIFYNKCLFGGTY